MPQGSKDGPRSPGTHDRAVPGARRATIQGGAAWGAVGLLLGALTAHLVLDAAHARLLVDAPPPPAGADIVNVTAVGTAGATLPYAWALAGLAVLAWCAGRTVRSWPRSLGVALAVCALWIAVAWTTAAHPSVSLWWPGPWPPLAVDGGREVTPSAVAGPVVTTVVVSLAAASASLRSPGRR